jgi:hypothetical protein
MARLSEWIMEMAAGEAIEGVVIGELESETDWASDDPVLKHPYQGVVLSWESALPHISYEFNQKSGSPTCHHVTAWTASWVISVTECFGYTAPFRVPRNPRNHEPDMPGG